VLAHGVRPRVVGRQRQMRIAEALQHHREVAGRAVEVLLGVTRVNAEVARGVGHQLTKANGARM